MNILPKLLKSKTLYSALLLALMVGSPVLAAPGAGTQKNILPNPDIIGGQQFYLEVSQIGNLNALDAPESYAKFYFDSTSASIGVFDGCWSQKTNNLDGNASGSTTCLAGARYNTQFSFYSTDENENPVGSPLVVDGQALASNNWSDIFFPISGSKSNRNGKYVVFMRAEFQMDTVAAGYSGGRVNAFKLRANGAGAAAGNANTTARPFSVQHRGTAPSSTEDTMKVEFGTFCNLTQASSHQLIWSDADYQSGDDDIEFSLYKILSSGQRQAVTLRINNQNFTTVSGANIGGNNVEGRADFTADPDGKYQWEWRNVNKSNGIQIKLPFDTYDYYRDCNPGDPEEPIGKAWVQGYKVMHEDGGHPLDTALDAISVEMFAGPDSPKAQASNPFNFGDLKPGSYRFRANNLSSLPAGYSYEGYTLCRNRIDCHTGSHSSGSATATGEIVVSDPIPEENTYYDLWFHFKFTPPAASARHRIYGANELQGSRPFVRDNESFKIDLLAYLWPDAGIRNRGSNNTSRFWLAGIWGNSSSDTFTNDNSTRTNPNNMTSFNTKAEEGCPGAGNCRQRVPLAYVFENDGQGVGATAIKDGSTTPKGNRWYSIFRRTFNEFSGSQSSINCQPNRRYLSGCGGIASNLDSDVGGFRGNRINDVEISNIHVRANNIQANDADASLQGKVNNLSLQPDARSLNMPGGDATSQGPRSAAGSLINTWDNIRNASSGTPGRLTSVAINNNPKFINTVGSPLNFTYNPRDMLNNYRQNALPYREVTATSLLQDGRDPSAKPYSAAQEPLTYTATVKEANIDLVWDEYIDWTQADDKGHWYTTKSDRITGIERGQAQSTTVSLQKFDSGSRQIDFVETHHDRTHFHQSGPECGYSGTGKNRRANSCSHHHHWMDYEHTHYTPCTGNYTWNQSWRYVYNNITYYSPTEQSRFGWHNTKSSFRNMPYGLNGQTRSSAFWNSYSNNPGWTNTGSTAYWQDTGRTSMDNSGSAKKPAHSQRWIYNQTDPAYTGRQLYSTPNTPQFPVGWQYVTASSCKYRNGNGISSNGTQTVGPYYPSRRALRENDMSASGFIYGRYGSSISSTNATFDGTSDGLVDVGWNWAPNIQRVRYEDTFKDRFRKLGRRSIAASIASGERLFGLENNLAIKPSRTTALIVNPTVAANNADIFAGGNIDSYFQNSEANGAFLFSNRRIENFSDALSKFEQYFINPNQNRVNSTYPSPDELNAAGATDPVEYVFQDYQDLVGRAATIGSSSLSGSFNLDRGSDNNRSNNVFIRRGNLRLNGNTFVGGAGTIIVEGNLYISGNSSYSGGTSAKNIPSVGFIVKGNIIVEPQVGKVVGTYFTNGTYHTGSRLLNTVVDSSGRVVDTPNSNRLAADTPFTLNGLIVARNFVLARQLSGSDNLNLNAEQFNYDGRIVIAPPPGFSRIFTADAVWNDTVPRN